MARLWYGGTSADFVVSQGEQAEIYVSAEFPTEMFGRLVLIPLDSAGFTAYTDAALTTVTTDLLDSNGDPTAEVVSLIEFDDRGTIPRFQGPDGHTGPLWLSADTVTGYRFEPESDLLYARVLAAEADLATAATDVTALEAGVTALDTRVDALEAVPDTPNVQYFSSPGSTSWTKPAGARRVLAECQGGGGAGGGVPTTAAGQGAEGGGGGGGGYGAVWYDADGLGSTEDVVVGAGGTGVSGGTGNDGGATTFRTAGFGAEGGGGGTVSTASSGGVFANGGAGGTGFDNGEGTPTIRANGGRGKPGHVQGSNGTTMRNNAGGSAGSGSGEQHLTSATASGNGAVGARGSGGSGARNAASQGSAWTGGAGGDGWVRVSTYF